MLLKYFGLIFFDVLCKRVCSNTVDLVELIFFPHHAAMIIRMRLILDFVLKILPAAWKMINLSPTLTEPIFLLIIIITSTSSPM